MTDQHRARVLRSRVSGEASAVVKKRSAPAQSPAEKTVGGVVSFFADDSTTTVRDFLKAVRPEARQHRGFDKIHVSDLLNGCARRIALHRRLGLPVPSDTVWDGRGISFATGNATHDFVKSRLIAGHNDKFWAKWSCLCRQQTFLGVGQDVPKDPCDQCLSPMVIPHEVPFEQEELDLVGTPDALLLLRDYDAFYPVEIKSVSGKIWQEIARPRPDDTVQLAIYGKLLLNNGFRVTDIGSVLYVNRDSMFKNPYKEFPIQLSEVNIDPYYEDLKDLVVAKNGGPLPERKVCPSTDCATAKSCPVRVQCWGMP